MGMVRTSREGRKDFPKNHVIMTRYFVFYVIILYVFGAKRIHTFSRITFHLVLSTAS